MNETDLDLLARYTWQHAEDAFAEIVRRHLDLVFSAALRQVRSPQLAEEVAQSTFINLARDANRLASDTILAAWLYQVAHRTAVNVVRREARRQMREQIATEMNATNATATDWTHIEPLLDEAMHALDSTDRAAILLRYFENKSLREVGQRLGTSENAAQKRLSRAVECLREFFARRGVTVGASGLVVFISGNAVQAAPVGLSAAVSTAALVAGTLASATIAIKTTLTTMNWINTKAMTAIIASAIAAGTGTYFVQQRGASDLRIRNQNLLAQQEKLIGERDTALSASTVNNDELDRLRNDKNELLRLRGQVTALRQAEQENSGLKAERDSLATRLKQASIELRDKQPELRVKQPELRLNGISFKGHSIFTEAELARILDSRVDEPFEQEKLDKDVREMWKMYKEAGYGGTAIRAMQETDKQSGRTTVTFVLEEALEK